MKIEFEIKGMWGSLAVQSVIYLAAYLLFRYVLRAHSDWFMISFMIPWYAARIYEALDRRIDPR